MDTRHNGARAGHNGAGAASANGGNGRPSTPARAGGLPRVCVIGAGASGIPTCKALSDRGVPYDCFDKGHRVGGIWVLDSESGLSSAYRELHINVSRERMEYRDYPMPKSLPPFPHHTQIVDYFEDYVRHFGLEPNIHLRTGVERAERTAEGLWQVTLDTGERRLYDALIVANGHHSVPRWPDPPIPGEFDGLQMHSHDYRDDTVLRDRDVVVLGLGNSAMDIAVESSYAARSTHLSIRRGAHILPKYLMGRPMDQIIWDRPLEHLLGRGFGVGPLAFQIPWRVRSAIVQSGLRILVGKMSDYGLPDPAHSYGAQHPTISTRLLDRLVHGRITPKPAIERFDGDDVVFTDGTRTRADVVVFATGYLMAFPFLPPDLVPISDNQPDLYWNVFPPDIPNMACIGLLQPTSGSTMQISESQARWVAAYMAGDYALPPRRDMLGSIERRQRRTAKRYVKSERHTIQVEQFEFEWFLRDELRRGRKRVQRAGPGVRAHAAERSAADDRLTVG